LSWYIRPLFIIPFIYFAYKRSWSGMIVTLVALATSMFWFPAPITIDPSVAQFLEVERQYLLGPWTGTKVFLWLMVPLFFALLAVSFWKRSWWWGLTVINIAAIAKIAWSVVEGGESGWAVLVPAAIGLVICDAAVYFGVRYLEQRKLRQTNA
jgi:hypothetical protein